MKKKFSLWLNIATICLCICAIAVGVYSAQNATLNVSGQVGFKAHNCEMVMTNYTIANSSRQNGATEVSSAFSDYLPSESLTSFPTEGITIKDTVSFNMGKFYFVDDTTQNKIPDIVITFTIRNESAFKVTATITEKISTNASTKDKIELVNFTSTKGFDKKGETNAARDIVLTLRLKDTTIETLELNDIELFSIKFEKDDDAQIHNQGEYYVENNRLYVEYGYYPTTDKDADIVDTSNASISGAKIYGDNLGKPIRWVAFSADGTTALTNVTSVPTSGTYYFISEYVLTPGMAFNSNSTTATNGKNPNDYEVSAVRTYITTGSFVTDYQLSALVEKVTARNLPAETITEFASDVDSAYKTAGKAINNCTDSLWLISKTEFDLVKSVMGKNIAYYPSQADQIYNTSPTQYGAHWWLRSPENEDDDTICTGENISLGRYFATVSDDYYGIRPAFQIEI